MTDLERLIAALHHVTVGNHGALERLVDLQGAMACRQIRQLPQIGSLADVEFKVYSQWGEDGIIDWLVQHVPVRAERFIEFGVESYMESNTRFLLKQRNWKGLVIDRSADYVRLIAADPISWRHDLRAVAHFVTRENINALFVREGFKGPIGLLSIDIDGNDYWVWEKIDAVEPDIVVCEYNPMFGDLQPISIPHNADFDRMKAHHSGCYFGASVAALSHLAARKGYSLVGTNTAGCNAFFVHDRHFPALSARIADKRPHPARFRVSRDPAGNLDHKTTLEAVELIKDLPVQRVDTQQISPLGAIGPLFSPEWLREIRAE
jgi:hypothetical protein